MTAGPWDPMAARRAGRDRLRASDPDRARVIDALKIAFVQGRLAKDEFCMRAGQALALAIAFLTHYVGFFAMFLVAFIGVTVTAQPDG